MSYQVLPVFACLCQLDSASTEQLRARSLRVVWLCEEMSLPDQLQFGESGLAMYGNPLIATRFRAPEDKRDNWTVDYLKKTVAQRLEFVEKQLGDGPYITGSRFTAADISLGYTVGIVNFVVGIKLSPALQAYHDRLTARPAYQRAMAAA